MDFPELTGTQKSKDGKATINLYAQADGGLVWRIKMFENDSELPPSKRSCGKRTYGGMDMRREENSVSRTALWLHPGGRRPARKTEEVADGRNHRRRAQWISPQRTPKWGRQSHAAEDAGKTLGKRKKEIP